MQVNNSTQLQVNAYAVQQGAVNNAAADRQQAPARENATPAATVDLSPAARRLAAAQDQQRAAATRNAREEAAESRAEARRETRAAEQAEGPRTAEVQGRPPRRLDLVA